MRKSLLFLVALVGLQQSTIKAFSWGPSLISSQNLILITGAATGFAAGAAASDSVDENFSLLLDPNTDLRTKSISALKFAGVTALLFAIPDVARKYTTPNVAAFTSLCALGSIWGSFFTSQPDTGHEGVRPRLHQVRPRRSLSPRQYTPKQARSSCLPPE